MKLEALVVLVVVEVPGGEVLMLVVLALLVELVLAERLEMVEKVHLHLLVQAQPQQQRFY